jgi:hypothetical protein
MEEQKGTGLNGQDSSQQEKERSKKISTIAHEVLDKFFSDQDYKITDEKLKLLDDIVFFIREKCGISRLELCDERLPMQDFHEILWFALAFAVHEKSVPDPDAKWPFSEAGTAEDSERVVCPHCGANVPKGNFCAVCAQKMVETCDCWVKSKPYNCGHEKCSGWHLIVEEIKEKKARLNA